MERIVILGGGYAGAMAASRLAQRGIAVTLIEEGEGLVERIRLHQVAVGDDEFGAPQSSAAVPPNEGAAAYVADHLAGVTSDAFTFAYAVTCISLGRSDGVIQMKHPDDRARERFMSGRAGAWIKELVCRYALLSIRMERLGVRYRWPKAIAA